MQSIKIEITGKVYKVGFRYFIKQMAERLGVSGTVKYSDDHTIIIEASGRDTALNRLIGYCRLGCLGADVKNISVTECSTRYEHSFIIQFEDIVENKGM